MLVTKRFFFTVLLSVMAVLPLCSQTIAEKKAGLVHGDSDMNQDMQKVLSQVNEELFHMQQELRELYSRALEYYQEGAPQALYEGLLLEINDIRANMHAVKETWRKMVTKSSAEEENYALWHQPETSVEQLVIDYGSQDYVYLIPEDIGEIKLSVTSNIPIPRASWNQMLEEILVQNGVGIRELNPFLRELFALKDDNSDLKIITNNRRDLEVYPPNARVSFVLSPEPADVRRSWYFLEKFVNPNSTSLQLIGRDILIVGRVIDVKELLKVYDFVSSTRGDRDYKVITLRKVDPEEMVKILESIFGEFQEEPSVEEVVEGQTKVKKKGGSKNKDSGNGLRVFNMGELAHSIFLVGTTEEIRRAEEIILEVENQIGEAREKVIYRYQVKHSEPEDLAQVLEKIYKLMIETGVGMKKGGQLTEKDLESAVQNAISEVQAQMPPPQPDPVVVSPYQVPLGVDPYAIAPGAMPVNPPFVEPQPPTIKKVNLGRDNFIVDPKTSTIVMVVEADILPKLKELLRKLDIPKKMVHIDVMLFEKRLDRNTSFGLNLLKIGSEASQTRKSSICWNDTVVNDQQAVEGIGLFQFLLSRMKNGAMPAYDLIYNFLITQNDITLNASPSVVAVNQTPATISLIDEISIDTGTFFFDTAGTTVPQRTFERRQYGITITITPTIHTRDFDDEEVTYEDEDYDSVTLETDIVFDSFQRNIRAPDRPDVNRRKVKNVVRIPDGQSVIIGGLRDKRTSDSKSAIPFLGEIPGVGKLFSTNEMEDRSKELIIFITPKIIRDPKADFYRIRRQELCKRPGDIPEFLCRLNAALNGEKYRAFQGTLTFLFGRMQERCVCTEGEWDGR